MSKPFLLPSGLVFSKLNNQPDIINYFLNLHVTCKAFEGSIAFEVDYILVNFPYHELL